MINNVKRVIGHEQDYPGSCRWPIYAVLCPECQQWAKDYGSVTTEIDGKEYALCEKCGDEAFPPDVGAQS